MSYDPAFVAAGERQGVFPQSTRPFVLDDGTLQNTIWGMPTVLDPDRVPADSRASLDNATGPHVLSDLGRPVTELPVDDVARIARRWKSEVLP